MKGKRVLVTGILEFFTRSSADQAIKAAGGWPTTSVAPDVDIVVAGEGPGAKADKARELGIEIIDEAEFIRRLGKKPEELL
jgi:DNA ligase (NAD+)